MGGRFLCWMDDRYACFPSLHVLGGVTCLLHFSTLVNSDGGVNHELTFFLVDLTPEVSSMTTSYPA